MKATIISLGDSDVGMPSTESYVELGFDISDKEDRESVRAILERCFDELHDSGKTLVTFEDEEREFLTGGWYD